MHISFSQANHAVNLKQNNVYLFHCTYLLSAMNENTIINNTNLIRNNTKRNSLSKCPIVSLEKENDRFSILCYCEIYSVFNILSLLKNIL